LLGLSASFSISFAACTGSELAAELEAVSETVLCSFLPSLSGYQVFLSFRQNGTAILEKVID
jgi:hypothetical protein